MSVLSFNNDLSFINRGNSFARMILLKLVSQLADFISIVPKFKDPKINNMLKESNIEEKLRYATYIALTAHNRVSAVSVEKNHRERWVIKVNEVTYFEREDLQRLTRIKVLVNFKEINGFKNKLLREYFFKNGEVHSRYLREDERGNINNSDKNIFQGVELNKEENLKLKVIPIVLWKGHLGDNITIEDRVFEILQQADKIFKTFIQQQAIQGGKFLINGSPVNTSNVNGESAEKKLVRALQNGDNVIVNPSVVSTSDKPTIEPVILNTQLQEFRANLDWLLTAAKEYSLIPDFNSGDKGTANIQTAEVDANMKGKNKHLEQWNVLKNKEWEDLMNIYYLRSGNKKAKEEEIELDLTDNKKIKEDNEKKLSQQIKMKETNEEEEVKENE